jgi:hypothetical protein
MFTAAKIHFFLIWHTFLWKKIFESYFLYLCTLKLKEAL